MQKLVRQIGKIICISIFAASINSSAYSKPQQKKKDSISEYQQFISNVKFDASDIEQAQADTIRMQGIKGTYSLINDRSISKSEKFELYLRLGQLHLERHDFLKHVEMKSYHARFDAYEKKKKDLERKGYTKQANALKEPTLLQNGSIKELNKSIKALKYAVTKYPKERRLDIALYTLGQSLLLQKKDSGHKYLRQLIQKFPKSHLYPDANLALGEYYFDKQKHNTATKYYQKLLNFKSHKGYLYAIYKLGWSNYNISFNDQDPTPRLKKALAGFKIVIRQSEKKRWSNSFNLREEALNDIILIFSEIGDVELARDYFFAKNEKERFYKTVMRIGSKLTDSGKNDLAVQTYRVVINEAPFNEHTPLAFSQILLNEEAKGRLKNIANTLKEMVKFFGHNGLWDSKKDSIDKDVLADAKKTLELKIKHYGTKYHKIGQKSANQNFLISAARIYQIYLEEFKSGPSSIEIRHYLADILLGFKQYEQAGRHFMIVVKNKHGKKHRVEALNNALFAFEKAVTLAKIKKPGNLGKLEKPVKIPDIKVSYLDALLQLVKILPKDKRVVRAKYSVASTLYEYGFYSKSLDRFFEITKNNSSDKLAEKATKVSLNHHYNRKDWLKTIESSKAFLDNNPLMKHRGLKGYILNINKNAYFNYALELEENDKFSEAAAYFVKFQKNFPKDPNADKALYNASINFHKAGETDKSIRTGKLLISAYRNSSLTKDMMAWVADTLESTARFDEAIVYYTDFHKLYPNDRRSRQFLYNAATLSSGLENGKESIKLFNLYTSFYPRDDSSESVRFMTAEQEFKIGNATAARKIYEWLSFNASTEEKRMEAKAEGMIILLKQDKRSGVSRLKSFARQLRNSKLSAYNARDIVSRELLNLLEPEILAYNKMKIKDGNRLMEDISKKNTKLRALSQKLEEVAQIGLSEYSVAALYILGDLHEDIANDILNAPYPSDITDAEKDDIKKQLVEVSTPLFADSNAFYQRAYQIAQETNTFSDWSIKITRKMKDKFPDIVATSEYETVSPDYLSHEIMLNDDTNPLLR